MILLRISLKVYFALKQETKIVKLRFFGKKNQILIELKRKLGASPETIYINFLQKKNFRKIFKAKMPSFFVILCVFIITV